MAKYWLDLIELAHNGGYNRGQLETILVLIRAHHSEFMENWREFCDHG